MRLTRFEKLILCTVAGLLVAMVALRAEVPARADLIARGEYLVKNVGLCSDCHTPMTDKGPNMELFLMGAALPFQPTVEMPWSPVAPPIAGLPSMSEEQAVVFFTRGTRPDGSLPRPPMPGFRFNDGDARAVTAYLKSLAP
jgi:mono/diheme cytochrome c family protein